MTEERVREIVNEELDKRLKPVAELDRKAAWERAHMACKQAFVDDDFNNRFGVAAQLVRELYEKKAAS